MGSRDNPFTTMPPSACKSRMCSNSTPYPNVPEAAITGFRSEIPQSETDRSGMQNPREKEYLHNIMSERLQETVRDTMFPTSLNIRISRLTLYAKLLKGPVPR